METVQQHEWGNRDCDLVFNKQYCKNGCGCIRYEHQLHYDVWYYDPQKIRAVENEPPCITRTKQPEDGKTQSNT